MDPVDTEKLRRWLRKHPGVDRYGDALPPGVLTRLGTGRLRANDCIRALAFSPDTKLLAAADGDSGRVILFELPSGRVLRSLQQERSVRVKSLAFSPDGRLLASGGDDEIIHLWNPATGRQLRQMAGSRGEVRCVAFAPDGRTIASANLGGSACVWDSVSGKLLLDLHVPRSPQSAYDDSFWSVAFSSDGRLLTAGSQYFFTREPSRQEVKEYRQRIRMARQGKWPVRRVRKPLPEFWGDGTEVCEKQGRVWVWQLPDGKLLVELRSHHGKVDAVAFLPDDELLVSGARDTSVCLWDWNSRKRLKTFYCSGGAEMPAPLLLSRDGKSIIASGTEIILYNLKTGKRIRNFDKSDGRWSFATALSQDGKVLAAGLHGRSISLWDFATGKDLVQMPRNVSEPVDVLFSPDSRTIASNDGQTVLIWEARSGRALARMVSRAACLLKQVYSPDGRRLAIGGYCDGNDGIWVWHLASAKPVLLLRNVVATALAWLPSGDSLAIGVGSDGLHVYDAKSRRRIRRLTRTQNEVTSLASSAQGNLLASHNDDGVVHVWDLTTRKLQHEFETLPSKVQECGPAPTHLVFSPDGKFLAWGNPEGRTYVWDCCRGKRSHEFQAPYLPERRIRSYVVGFTSDGHALAAGAASQTGPEDSWKIKDDYAIWIWDIPTGAELFVSPGHDRPVSSLAFSPSGHLLASGHWDSTTLVWNLREALGASGSPVW